MNVILKRNSTVIVKMDSSEKDSQNNKNVIDHKKKAVGTNDNSKLHISDTQDIGKRTIFNIKDGSIKKFLSYVFLQLLLLLYVIKGYRSITNEEKTIVSMYNYSKDKIKNWEHRMIEIKNRILAEGVSEIDESFRTLVASEEEEQSEWKPNLPDGIQTSCNEYKRLTKELKEKIFLNHLEFHAFLNEMEDQKITVEFCVPELLNKNESNDILQAKILNYYEPFTGENLNIINLASSLNDFFVVLSYLQDSMEAKDPDDAVEYMTEAEKYKRRIIRYDPDSHGVIDKRLKELQEKLTSRSDENPRNVLQKEIKNLIQLVGICHDYADTLQSISENDESMKQSMLVDLYKMERKLEGQVPDFYGLYIFRKNNRTPDK